MKALQRLVITGHWAAFIWLVFMIGVIFYFFAMPPAPFTSDGWAMLLGAFLPTAAFTLGGWIFNGKFILWPWNRSLPKQED
jgi:hypothetical protein